MALLYVYLVPHICAWTIKMFLFCIQNVCVIAIDVSWKKVECFQAIHPADCLNTTNALDIHCSQTLVTHTYWMHVHNGHAHSHTHTHTHTHIVDTNMCTHMDWSYICWTHTHWSYMQWMHALVACTLHRPTLVVHTHIAHTHTHTLDTPTLDMHVLDTHTGLTLTLDIPTLLTHTHSHCSCMHWTHWPHSHIIGTAMCTHIYAYWCFCWGENTFSPVFGWCKWSKRLLHLQELLTAGNPNFKADSPEMFSCHYRHGNPFAVPLIPMIVHTLVIYQTSEKRLANSGKRGGGGTLGNEILFSCSSVDMVESWNHK